MKTALGGLPSVSNRFALVALSRVESSAQSDVPAAPTGLVASSVAHDSVTLGWDDPGDASITGYTILRRDIARDLPGVFSTLIGNTGSALTSYTDTTVSLVDLYATLAEIVGEEPDVGVAPDSISLMPILRGEAESRGMPLVHNASYHKFAIREGDWKLIFGSPDELYNLRSDPREVESVHSDEPDVVERLESEMARIRASEEGTLSSVATLKSLSIAGVDFGEFDPEVDTYSTSLTYATKSVEVVTVPTITDARVTISADGSFGYGKPKRGRAEVVVSESPSTDIRISVVSPDGSTTTTYTVTIAIVDFPTVSGVPTISGTARVGQVLTADASGISDTDGMENAVFAYQWKVGGRDVAGATDSAYTIRHRDEGYGVKVTVSFTDDAGNVESVTSESVTVADEAISQPQGLSASVENVTVVLDWDDPADAFKITSYRILRHRPEAGEPDPLTYVEFTESSATRYVDTGVEEGVLYVYRVQALDFFGFSGEASGAVSVRVPVTIPDLTAEISGAPSSHDGETAFTFELRFSEQIPISYATLSGSAFIVEGGSVLNARRLERDSANRNIRWEITVEPDGDGDVSIVLPVTQDCDDVGAICAEDGRMLLSRTRSRWRDRVARRFSQFCSVAER